ncbi:hypothetical protein ACFL3T_02290 [Patescibacteria group bacterium]
MPERTEFKPEALVRKSMFEQAVADYFQGEPEHMRTLDQRIRNILKNCADTEEYMTLIGCLKNYTLKLRGIEPEPHKRREAVRLRDALIKKLNDEYLEGGEFHFPTDREKEYKEAVDTRTKVNEVLIGHFRDELLLKFGEVVVLMRAFDEILKEGESSQRFHFTRSNMRDLYEDINTIKDEFNSGSKIWILIDSLANQLDKQMSQQAWNEVNQQIIAMFAGKVEELERLITADDVAELC